MDLAAVEERMWESCRVQADRSFCQDVCSFYDIASLGALFTESKTQMHFIEYQVIYEGRVCNNQPLYLQIWARLSLSVIIKFDDVTKTMYGVSAFAVQS